MWDIRFIPGAIHYYSLKYSCFFFLQSHQSPVREDGEDVGVAAAGLLEVVEATMTGTPVEAETPVETPVEAEAAVDAEAVEGIKDICHI